MHPEQEPPQIPTNETDPELSEPITNPGFWHTHRGIVIVTLVILAVVVIAALIVWHKKSNPAGNPVAKTNVPTTNKSKPADQSSNT